MADNQISNETQVYLENLALMTRASLVRVMQEKENKNLDEECGYPPEIGPEDYWTMFRRNGIAQRVVGVYPEECWALYPEIYEVADEDTTTPFEEAWKDIIIRQNIFHYLKRLDEVSGIGTFGVMLLGIDDGRDLDKPIAGIDERGDVVDRSNRNGKAPRLTYLRVFPEVLVEVSDWEKNPKNPRYGRPTQYKITMADVDRGVHMITDDIPGKTLTVHWSRIIHAADNCVSSEIFGAPRMEPVFNYLLDIKKTLGGSAEMFWKGGFPGVSFEMTPEVAAQMSQLSPDEQGRIKESLRDEYHKYQQGLQRFLALIGVSAKPLNPQIADPSQQFDSQISAICITLGIPKRIFMGSERGQLASNQDSEHWNKRVQSRQNEYMTPMLIRVLIDRLVAIGILPTPQQGYFVDWPDINSPGEIDIAKIAASVTQALSHYVAGDVALVIPPKEYFTLILKWPAHVADAVIRATEASMEAHKETGLIGSSESEMSPSDEIPDVELATD
jgi:uncharacterized protein